MSGTWMLTVSFLAVGTPLYIAVCCMIASDARERRVATAARRAS